VISAIIGSVFNRAITVHVDFPALTDLVAWLRGSEQAEIDRLTQQIQEVTDQLKQSASFLKTAVDSAH